MTGAPGDGAALVDAALALGKSGTPMLAINALQTQTEKDEQSGLAILIKGLGGLYRNPTAHDLRLSRAVTDEELLEALTMVSMVHRGSKRGSTRWRCQLVPQNEGASSGTSRHGQKRAELWAVPDKA